MEDHRNYNQGEQAVKWERTRVLQVIAELRGNWQRTFVNQSLLSSSKARDSSIHCEGAIAALDELRKKIEDNG